MSMNDRNQAPPETITLINNLLNHIRDEQGLTSDDQLCKHLDVSDLSIYRWRRGYMSRSTEILLPLVYDFAKESVLAS